MIMQSNHLQNLAEYSRLKNWRCCIEIWSFIEKLKSLSTISYQISYNKKKETETNHCKTTAWTKWLPKLQKTRLGLDPFDSKLSAPRCTTPMGIAKLRRNETSSWCWMLIELENIGCCFERWAFEIWKRCHSGIFVHLGTMVNSSI